MNSVISRFCSLRYAEQFSIVAFHSLNFAFFVSFFFFSHFCVNCFMVENLQVLNYSDFRQTIDFILTPIRGKSNLFIYLFIFLPIPRDRGGDSFDKAGS